MWIKRLWWTEIHWCEILMFSSNKWWKPYQLSGTRKWNHLLFLESCISAMVLKVVEGCTDKRFYSSLMRKKFSSGKTVLLYCRVVGMFLSQRDRRDGADNKRSHQKHTTPSWVFYFYNRNILLNSDILKQRLQVHLQIKSHFNMADELMIHV